MPPENPTNPLRKLRYHRIILQNGAPFVWLNAHRASPAFNSYRFDRAPGRRWHRLRPRPLRPRRKDSIRPLRRHICPIDLPRHIAHHITRPGRRPDRPRLRIDPGNPINQHIRMRQIEPRIQRQSHHRRGSVSPASSRLTIPSTVCALFVSKRMHPTRKTPLPHPDARAPPQKLKLSGHVAGVSPDLKTS